MVMQGEEPTSSSVTPCEACATPPGEQAPCDHSSPVACSSMSSCVGGVALVVVPAVSAVWRSSGVLARSSPLPEVPTSSPESPPPRA